MWPRVTGQANAPCLIKPLPKASFDESIKGFGIVADIVFITAFGNIQWCIFPAVTMMRPKPRSFKPCPKSFDMVGMDSSLEDALTPSVNRVP